MNLKAVKGQWTAHLSLNLLAGKAHAILNWWPWDWTAINYIPDSRMSGASKYHECPLIGPKMEELWVHQLVFPKDPDFLRKSQCHAMPMFGSCPVFLSHSSDQTTVINMALYCCKSVCSIYSPLKYLHLGCRCISIEHTLHLSMYLSCRSSYRSVYPSYCLPVNRSRWLTLCKRECSICSSSVPANRMPI